MGTAPRKPYDVRERLFLFACDVVRIAQKLHTRGPIAGSFPFSSLPPPFRPPQTRKRPTMLRALIDEARQLRLIVSTILRNNSRNARPERRFRHQHLHLRPHRERISSSEFTFSSTSFPFGPYDSGF